MEYSGLERSPPDLAVCPRALAALLAFLELAGMFVAVFLAHDKNVNAMWGSEVIGYTWSTSGTMETRRVEAAGGCGPGGAGG